MFGGVPAAWIAGTIATATTTHNAHIIVNVCRCCRWRRTVDVDNARQELQTLAGMWCPVFIVAPKIHWSSPLSLQLSSCGSIFPLMPFDDSGTPDLYATISWSGLLCGLSLSLGVSLSFSVRILYPVSVFQSQVAQQPFVFYNHRSSLRKKALSAIVVLSLKEGLYQSRDTREKTMRIYQQNIRWKNKKQTKQTNKQTNNNNNNNSNNIHITKNSNETT